MTCIVWVQSLKSRGEKRTDPVKKRASVVVQLSEFNKYWLTICYVFRL